MHHIQQFDARRTVVLIRARTARADRAPTPPDWSVGGLVVDVSRTNVLLDGLDCLQRRRLAGVRLAGGNRLPVAGHQVEAELSVAGLLHDELHRQPPPGWPLTRR